MPTPASADWSLTSVADESQPGCELVLQWLREYNRTTSPAFFQKLDQPEHHARPLVLLASDPSGIAGGLLAETQFAWLKISKLAVKPGRRAQGLGSALPAEAERQAVARHCKYAFLDTMDYQAPRFYLAHGYEIVGEIPDWDSHGHTKFYFRKHLAPATESD